MNFKTIFATLLMIVAAGAQAIVAQQLPDAHSHSIEAAQIYNDIAEKSFTDMAFTASRAGTPFEDAVADGLSTVDMALANNITEYAHKFLGTPYVWGATGPKSFDCSGFVGYVYRNFGFHLPRTSSEQSTRGERVNSVSEMQPGDLMFFSSRRSGASGVGHVAMVVSVDRENGTCKFIHASTGRGVVLQNFPDNGYYSKHFRGARRILNPESIAQAQR